MQLLEDWIEIKGVRVHYRCDTKGNLMSVRPESPITDIRLDELLCEAMWHRWGIATDQANETLRRAAATERTNASTRTLREKAREHFSFEWLQAAYNGHPDHGAERLALEARKIAFRNELPAARREQITEYRAKQFLKTKRKK